ncbi:Anti-repressor SinI [Salinibacillus kushneri]|uniref:Anti-repressor SinI n=1 Tax=Salinibacillus kushneri TaxID=237682 RepID=A0A1I0CGH2_9BACI|nr:anti-repressor SinI family protein [Salinibacillus kushneri]SET18189.1 Anti-repressor SinI [Salinibacillus kushneri]
MKEVGGKWDQEWAGLLLEAKKIGLSIEEVKAFLEKGKMVYHDEQPYRRLDKIK